MTNKDDRHRRYITFLICLFLILMTYVSFRQIMNNKFINFDDNDYVVRNYRKEVVMTKAALSFNMTFTSKTG